MTIVGLATAEPARSIEQSEALMIECPTVTKKVVRFHYDLSTPFYWLFWGPHIHHGLWDGGESPSQAQQRLTETLVCEAGIRGGESVLDVGCGMGGSSIHLARKLGCRVTGITISSMQRFWAKSAARWNRVASRTDFRCVDAEQVDIAAESFDVVWSIECTEHLYDKARFFQRAATWLRPGGRMAICAWLAGEGLEDQRLIRQVYDVCEGFFCPSLGTSGDYRQWMTGAGLSVDREHDWTARVEQTWEICRSRVRRSGVRWLAGLIHRDTAMFLDRFDTILNAYRNGAMRYGCFIATKPMRDGTTAQSPAMARWR
jgi:tocopherol O-methyltransferase